MAAGARSVTPRDRCDVTVADRDSALSHDARDAASSHVHRHVTHLDVPQAADEPACVTRHDQLSGPDAAVDRLSVFVVRSITCERMTLNDLWPRYFARWPILFDHI